MKLSELTNEELAAGIEKRIADEVPIYRDFWPVLNEVSKRLRGMDAMRAKLKVAEDALDSAWMYADKLPHQWPLPERVRTKMKNALAAIREKGGQDGQH